MYIHSIFPAQDHLSEQGMTMRNSHKFIKVRGSHEGEGPTAFGSRPIRWRLSASGNRTAHRSMRMRRLWTLLSDPASSTSAYAVSIVFLSAVIIMSATLCLETMPNVQGDMRVKVTQTYLVAQVVSNVLDVALSIPAVEAHGPAAWRCRMRLQAQVVSHERRPAARGPPLCWTVCQVYRRVNGIRYTQHKRSACQVATSQQPRSSRPWP